jgi:steroid delta-isomerase-like uncharacterized protein
MTLHAIKRLWQKHVLAENRRSIEGLLATLCAEPVYELMATGEKYLGREGVTKFYTGLFEGMPDATFDLVSVTIGENGVVEESVLRGTHTGPLFGIAASGKAVRLPLTIVFPFAEGKFLGERLYFDLRTLHTQLGVTDRSGY